MCIASDHKKEDFEGGREKHKKVEKESKLLGGVELPGVHQG
jgi:hypothetical protein